ncbi:HsdM family class I SAM-dependent methyltransferase [Vibrio aestuarianus]|uniref:HsdM family class I SAM-dependent methyltransferase n=1 Tax=Vibrio aestuarianus TaxID=28171 RepID=UPI00237C94D7|nr:N-6 DNA methylase [Vibrio aestuarianus]MDE1231592.1 SAM-dependent methyltransferase [Vibrio aestuarianus]
MKKLLKEIIKLSDKKGIRKQQAFEIFVNERVDHIINRKPLNNFDVLYLNAVNANPFVDVLEQVAVELGYFNNRLGQFMTPASVSAYLTLKSAHQEALDFSCGTGVNGLVMLAKMQASHTLVLDGKSQPIINIGFGRKALTLHLNDLDEMMCKVAFIQVLANYNMHCKNSFNLDLLITNNNVITEWESDLNIVYKSNVSKQDFTRLCDAKKDLLLLNPPYGLKDYGLSYAKQNQHQKRFSEHLPKKNDCESAFIQSAMELMTDKGECFLILPMNVNFSEKCYYVRKKILDDNLLDTSIALPAKLFSETSIPTTAWHLNKQRKKQAVYMLKLDKELQFFKKHTAISIFEGYKTINVSTKNAKSINISDLRHKVESLTDSKMVELNRRVLEHLKTPTAHINDGNLVDQKRA